ncbi:Thymidylate kinase [Ceratobasidium sp. 414]|nr:Thymidylate kinase [Ceratobasidium sp. 414]
MANAAGRATGKAYIIVGGSGLVGRYIARTLLGRGENLVRIIDVIPPDVSGDPSAADHLSRAEFVRADVTSYEAIRAAISQPFGDTGITAQVIIHTVGIIRAWERLSYLKHLSHKVNVGGTENVLKVSQELGTVRAFVFTSSAATFLPPANYLRLTRGRGVFFSEDPPDGMPLSYTHYPETKREADALVRAADNVKGYLKNTGPNLVWGGEYFQSIVNPWDLARAHVQLADALETRPEDVAGTAFAITGQRTTSSFDDLRRVIQASLQGLEGAKYLNDDVFDSSTALEIYDFSQPQVSLPLYILSHMVEAFLMIRFYVLSAFSKITGIRVTYVSQWAMTGDLVKLQPAMWDFAFADYIIDDSRVRKILGYENLWSNEQTLKWTHTKTSHDDQGQSVFQVANIGHAAKLNSLFLRPPLTTYLLRPWPLGDYLNPLSMSTSSSRSDSPGLDAITLSKLLWGDDSEDEDEVEDHILTGNTTLVSGTWKTSDDGTDNPDEAEVDGLIDTFDVEVPEHSFRRISSWRAGVVRGGDFDFVNQGQVLRKRQRSSVDLREQPVSKLAKLIVDQPICAACNSTFVSKNNLQRHGRRELKLGRLMQTLRPKRQKHAVRRLTMRLNDSNHTAPGLTFIALLTYFNSAHLLHHYLYAYAFCIITGAFLGLCPDLQRTRDARQRSVFLARLVGLDRSGKSTQCGQLMARVEATGKPVKTIKFPDRTTAIGKMINAYLQSESEVDDQTIHLLFSANRWEQALNIKSLLAGGTTIICDRYAYSGLAFSVAKNTGLSYEWCLNPDIGLPAPDIVFFLDVAPEVARKRGGFGEERYEKEELQANVRRVFKQIGSDVQERWEVVDANRSQSEVEEELWDQVKPLIDGVRRELGVMWATRVR